jgi:hypothetical protein
LSDPDGREDTEVSLIFYYSKSGQENFEKAAISAASDGAILVGFETESDFKSSWNFIAKHFDEKGIKVSKLEIFAHGGINYSDRTGTLEFNPVNDSLNNGTLTADEIRNLGQINFSKTGEIILHSCMSGVGGDNSVGQAFANSQNVTVQAQAGFTTFSDVFHEHSYVSPFATSPVYLESYNRSDNNRDGDGALMNRIIFKPN